MALGNKKINKIYEKSNTADRRYLSGAQIRKISQSYASAEYIKDRETFDTVSPIIYQLQLIEDDIFELRRHLTGSGELLDGGSF
jgi:hypothetical protein